MLAKWRFSERFFYLIAVPTSYTFSFVFGPAPGLDLTLRRVVCIDGMPWRHLVGKIANDDIFCATLPFL